MTKHKAAFESGDVGLGLHFKFNAAPLCQGGDTHTNTHRQDGRSLADRVNYYFISTCYLADLTECGSSVCERTSILLPEKVRKPEFHSGEGVNRGAPTHADARRTWEKVRTC